MSNGLGKVTESTPSSPRNDPPANPAPAPQAEPIVVDDLPDDLKRRITSRLYPASNKALRLTNRSFRQVGAERLTRLEIASTEIGTLDLLLRRLPYLLTVTITDLDDAGLAQLATMAPANRDMVMHIRASRSITDAGLVHLSTFTQLQSLDLTRCQKLTDAGLADLQGMTQLQSLNFAWCRKITDTGLADLQGMTQLPSLNLRGCRNITDAGLASLQGMTRLRSLNLSDCPNITDAGFAHLSEAPGNCQVTR